MTLHFHGRDWVVVAAPGRPVTRKGRTGRSLQVRLLYGVSVYSVVAWNDGTYSRPVSLRPWRLP